MLANSSTVIVWKPKDLSNESIKLPATSDNSLNQDIYNDSAKIWVKFDKSCLSLDKVTVIPELALNFYIV